MCKPDPNPGAIRSAEASERVGMRMADIAEEQLAFSKEQYAEILPFVKGIYQSQADIANANEARAQEFHDYWQSTYKPLEQQLVAEARDYNTEAARERFATEAKGDISSAYAGLRDQMGRSLGRYGINPSSQKFATLNATLNRDEALQTAGAMTDARNRAADVGYARKLDAAGLGRNLTGASQGAYGLALNAGNSAVANAQAPGNQLSAGYAGARAGFSGAAGAYGTAGQLYGQDYAQRMQGYNATMGLIGDITGAAGYIYGRRAEGGEIEGPGGPKDDTVPAMLSDGEYVVPAAVVKKLGVAHFDKLIAKHGDKGNKQALAARRGLKRRK